MNVRHFRRAAFALADFAERPMVNIRFHCQAHGLSYSLTEELCDMILDEVVFVLGERLPTTPESRSSACWNLASQFLGEKAVVRR